MRLFSLRASMPRRGFISGLTLLGALGALGVSGCKSTAPAAPDLPQAPAAFKHNAPATVHLTTPAQPQGAWWKAFGDAQLDTLMDAAAHGNTSIQAAAARLAKARALTRAADANRMPQASANAGVNHQGGPLINAAGASGTLWTLSAGASYEPDLFGRLAKELDAAALDAESRAALLQSAHLMVQADVAQSYFALRVLDAERRVLRDTVQAHRETLRVAERRFALGSIAELDVVRLRSEAAAAEAEALALERRRTELEHALALLTGEVASNFQVQESEWNGALPLIPAGIPSAVLTRRPDIAAAQRAVLAAQARVGVAKTAWFPALSLTTTQGFASTQLRDVIAIASRAWGVGALLSLPLFDGGRREAAIQGANADLDASVVSYREQILVAFKEVEDQLAALRFLADQTQAQQQAVAAAQRATALANSRYNSGLASQLELLDAQRSELRNRRQALQVRASQYQATVGLIRALGGGWETPSGNSAAHRDVNTRAAGL